MKVTTDNLEQYYTFVMNKIFKLLEVVCGTQHGQEIQLNAYKIVKIEEPDIQPTGVEHLRNLIVKYSFTDENDNIVELTIKVLSLDISLHNKDSHQTHFIAKLEDGLNDNITDLHKQLFIMISYAFEMFNMMLVNLKSRYNIEVIR